MMGRMGERGREKETDGVTVDENGLLVDFL